MIRTIWGQDEFLAAEAADAHLEAVDEPEVVSLSPEGQAIPGIEEALFAPSLFATRRVVVVREAERLTKSGAESLAEVLGRGEPAADLVVVAASERPPTTLLKVMKGFGEVQRLQAPKRGQLVAWVGERMQGRGVNAGRESAGLLVESVGGGLRALAQAVDQLATRAGPGGTIEADDVRRHFPGSSEKPVWALFDALHARKGPEAYRVLHQLLRQGDDPIAILFALVSQLRYLMRARSVLERSSGMSDADLASALGVSQGRAAVLKRQVGRMNWGWLVGVYGLCADADFELKGGEDGAVLPPEVVLERLLGAALDAA